MNHRESLGLKIESGRIYALDQTRLPHEEIWLECDSPEAMSEMIKRLAVRGAPLSGVAAAVALGKYVEQGANLQQFTEKALMLRQSRPTAVNLMNAVDRMLKMAGSGPDISTGKFLHGPEVVVAEALSIFDEDVELCAKLGQLGAQYISDGDSLISHCNAGGLATVGIGTSVGAIKQAHRDGKRIHVFVDETRPLLQGARLTAWELAKEKIPHTLITDSMAAYAMKTKKIASVWVGADRIARNGDVANKIGTYGLALAAKAHGVRFYVVAPYTTFDENCESGAQIPIELRAEAEVVGDRAPLGTSAWNPSFDVTEASLITAWVCDRKLPFMNRK